MLFAQASSVGANTVNVLEAVGRSSPVSLMRDTVVLNFGSLSKISKTLSSDGGITLSITWIIPLAVGISVSEMIAPSIVSFPLLELKFRDCP